jgi:DNA-binding MarR family transcriptional regulator
MPLSTVLFRVGRLEKRGHAERIPNPDDRRSYLVRLTSDGQRLLRQARPRFRSYAESVEATLGEKRISGLRDDLAQLREAIEAQLNSG